MISANSLEEVYEVLSLMDKLSVMKIPEETLNFIIKSRNSNFKTQIDKNDIFEENDNERQDEIFTDEMNERFYSFEQKVDDSDIFVEEEKNDIFEENANLQENSDDIFVNNLTNTFDPVKSNSSILGENINEEPFWPS